MIIFLGITSLCFLLGLIVYGLHRYQSIEVEYTVDRTMPLPPLPRNLPDISLPKAITRKEMPLLHEDAKKTASSLSTNTAISPANASKSQSWQDAVASAKKSGNLTEALRICEKQFPLWGAYNQYCIVLRSTLKGSTDLSPDQEHTLQDLYRTAAIAELLHDKSEGATSFTLNQLRSMPLELLDELALPYQQIGYAHLRLVRKSDVKLMLNAWGKPNSHLSPRQFHLEWWQEFSQKSA